MHAIVLIVIGALCLYAIVDYIIDPSHIDNQTYQRYDKTVRSKNKHKTADDDDDVRSEENDTLDDQAEDKRQLKNDDTSLNNNRQLPAVDTKNVK